MAEAKPGHNATLDYRAISANGKKYVARQFFLYVEKLSQSHTLSGSSSQGRYSKHFYARSYAPGDMELKVRCRSQDDYQNLALFVREHQRTLVAQPGKFEVTSSASAGFKRLLRLSVPSENIFYHGWIKTITISKKGVFEQAPECTLTYTVAFDNGFTEKTKQSLQIKSWTTVIQEAKAADAAVKKPKPPRHTPV